MNNPLLTDDLLPKFDHVRTEHMEPAIDQILSENRVKISQLAQQDEPTWETLAQPMQATEDRLERAWSVISHLNGVMNSDDLRKVYKNCLEKLTEYSTELSQNAELCEAYKKLAASDQYNELSEAQRKSVDNTLRDFHLGAVDLPQEKKEQYANLSMELSELSNRFSDNVLDATQHWFKHITFEPDTEHAPSMRSQGHCIEQEAAATNFDTQHIQAAADQPRVPEAAFYKVFDEILSTGPFNTHEEEINWWRLLPQVPAVTTVLIRLQSRRRWNPKALGNMFMHFPRLREIQYEPWREWGALQMEMTDEGEYHFIG